VTVEPDSVLQADKFMEFAIRFSPTAEGLRHATVSIASNDSSQDPYIFAIQGTGTPTPQPHIQVLGNHHLIINGSSTPTTISGTDFGSAVNGSGGGESTFQLTNRGTSELNLTGAPLVAISGAAASDFTVTVEPDSVVPADKFTEFAIRFSPTAEGLRHATVSIANSDSSNDPYIFAIQGTGTPAPKPYMTVLGGSRFMIFDGDTTPAIIDDTDFGSAVTGSGAGESTFRIANRGTADLDLTGTPLVAISGAAAGDFTVTVKPASTLAPNQFTDFTIRFSPTAEGLRHATVSIANNDNTVNPYTFAIQGTGTPAPQPHIVVSGNSHTIANGDTTPSPADNTDFGSAVSGSGNVEQTFQIDNGGTASLNLTGTPKVAISGAAAGDFSVTVEPASTLAPNHQSVFTIRFSPTAVGVREAMISISSNDTARSPYTFAIQGHSTAAPAPHISLLGLGHHISNGSTTATVVDGTGFGIVPAGETKEHVFSVNNSGSADLVLTSTPHVSVSGPGAAQFSVVAQPGSPIGPQSESRFTIAFTPAVGGQLAKATVTVSSDDASRSPYTFVIEGQGGMRTYYFPWVANQ